MSDIAQRFRRVAAAFSTAIDTVDGLEPDAWSNPSPCEGWRTRDVVRHLAEWIPWPGFLLGSYGIDIESAPSVDEDPAAAWASVRNAIQHGLDDPAVAARVAEVGPLGEMSFESAVGITVIPDVLVHTWDLAQAAGVDAPLDADELRRQYDAANSVPLEVDEAMRSSGHYGPRLAVASDADALTTVLAFYGRRNPTRDGAAE